MYAIVINGIASLMKTPTPSAERVDEALFGMKVEILEEQNGFALVKTPYRYKGWVEKNNLQFANEQTEEFLAAPKRVMKKGYADLLTEPRVQASLVVSVPRGARLAWTEENTEEGWRKVLLPDGLKAWTRDDYLTDLKETWECSEEEKIRTQLVNWAESYLGTQYRWGGKTPLGIDCSGLCSMAYMLCGITIHRDASIQPEFCMHQIPYEQIKKGDLIFFPGHVAMYVENGKIIHSTSHIGDEGVVRASLNPKDPDFRGDLLEKIITCGSVF